jgi:CheY-like chemotaxis protein
MSKKMPKSKYENVLLIDDNELDNFINQKIIESVSFAKNIYVNTSSSGALEFLNNLRVLKDKESELYPQVLFVDINMPIMDGFQFIENLVKTDPQARERSRIVILTTSLNPADKQRAESIAEDIVFLYKPLTEAMLDQL